MYPPVTSSTAAIKSQTFQGKGKVFYPTKTANYHPRPGEAGQGRTSAGKDNFSFRSSGNNDSHTWRTRSSGSNGSSSGTSSSPTVSSPLSRTSSVGSSNEERPGSAIARQAAVILRNSPPPVYHARIEKNNQTSMNAKRIAGHQTSTPAPRASKNSANKPFNHKEVLDQMAKAFHEATLAIQAGHGTFFNPNEHGPVVEFTPFDWEEFWGQRKMKGL
ncbi:hypothetical protein BV898_06919 [Hypsibius exemplaris]|uniref:Uncharacterized protein n=1 Tax=Hypsibius exemplaris TaxID=2072580 RepID=A0A1W0WV41_HYPEX|nr:hypothetical protein BV898_06919 [Hypsibius exemplaris]